MIKVKGTLIYLNKYKKNKIKWRDSTYPFRCVWWSQHNHGESNSVCTVATPGALGPRSHNWPAHCRLWKPGGGCGPADPRMDSRVPLPPPPAFDPEDRPRCTWLVDAGHVAVTTPLGSNPTGVLPSFPRSPYPSDPHWLPQPVPHPKRDESSPSSFWITKGLLCPTSGTNEKPGKHIFTIFNNEGTNFPITKMVSNKQDKRSMEKMVTP